MTFFADPAAFPCPPDGLFLGLDDRNREIGLPLERHALTIAGSGAGKGACLLIPNALRWGDNLLAVDPKGENAEATWQAREALGQSVHVLDPFQAANVPDRLRGAFNPLASIRVDSPTGREDCEVIADGLVKRSDPKHEEWYDGAGALLSGIIAYVVETAPPEHRTLTAVRQVLRQTNDSLAQDAERMQQCTAFGGLAAEAGVTIITALEASKGMEKDFLGGAKRSTRWLDAPQIAATLARSTFNLTDLKRGRASVYLVLPPKYLKTHAAYLRLFVRAAIEAMMEDGVDNGERCLFLLDEFFSLGRLDIVAESAGLMRGYKLHLWPFLQDIGQGRSLYGQAFDTFFANADAATFFGNTDLPTLEFVSRAVGTVQLEDLNLTPPQTTSVLTAADHVAASAPVPQPRPLHLPPTKKASANMMLTGVVGAVNLARHADYETEVQNQAARRAILDHIRQVEAAADANAMREYQHALSRRGEARITPDAVATLVGKGEGSTVARAIIAFLRGGSRLLLTPAPYFAPTPPVLPDPAEVKAEEQRKQWADFEAWKKARTSELAEPWGAVINFVTLCGLAGTIGYIIWRAWELRSDANIFNIGVGPTIIGFAIVFFGGLFVTAILRQLTITVAGKAIAQQLAREATERLTKLG